MSLALVNEAAEDTQNKPVSPRLATMQSLEAALKRQIAIYHRKKGESESLKRALLDAIDQKDKRIESLQYYNDMYIKKIKSLKQDLEAAQEEIERITSSRKPKAKKIREDVMQEFDEISPRSANFDGSVDLAVSARTKDEY